MTDFDRIIAIEEHAWTAELHAELVSQGTDETVTTYGGGDTNRRLLDMGDERIQRMQSTGVDFQVLSITTPGVQGLPPDIAVRLARGANDALAEAVRRHPDRFAAFATLAAQNPIAAADELRRCVDELGFVGAMVFPRAGTEQLDHERYQPIFAAAAERDVPLYIHPQLPPPAVRAACYDGFETTTNLLLASGGWGWHAEAGLAALRLILAGTFDRHPALQLILGHMGEMLVAFADRADVLTRTARLDRSVLDCITGNIYATPGGVLSHRMLRQVLDVLGPDRVMFALDDPFSTSFGHAGGDRVARTFIEEAPISGDQKAQLAHRNAERLLFKQSGL